MTIVLTLCVVAVAVLLLLLWFGRGQRMAIQSLADIHSHITPVDIPALMNLFDPQNDAYLRSRLTRAQYSKIRRERDQVGAEYVRRIASNSVVLLRANYYVRLNSPEPEARAVADQCVNLAIRTRAASLHMLVLLYLRILLPTVGNPVQLGRQYEAILHRTLVSFRQPAMISA